LNRIEYEYIKDMSDGWVEVTWYDIYADPSASPPTKATPKKMRSKGALVEVAIDDVECPYIVISACEDLEDDDYDWIGGEAIPIGCITRIRSITWENKDVQNGKDKVIIPSDPQ